MAAEARTPLTPDQEVFIAAMKEIDRQAQKEIDRRTHAPYAQASFWTAVAVLGTGLLLVGSSLLIAMAARNVTLATNLGGALAIPLCCLWLASAVGLIKGVLALIQARGKKMLAVWGVLISGLCCFGPLIALML
jgi:hypothetical protein